MKTKKVLIVLLTIAMLCSSFMSTASAEENLGGDTDTPEIYLTCEPYINGMYSSEATLVRGTQNTLSIRAVSYDGEPIEEEKIVYEWWTLNSDGSWNQVIKGETGSTYSFTYDGGAGYAYNITATLSDGTEKSTSSEFRLREDSLKVSGSCSDFESESDPEEPMYIRVKNVEIEKGGTLSVTASSTVGKTLSYQWYRHVIDSNWDMPQKIEGATENTYTFTKTAVGTEIYTCEVSEEDGEPKNVTFEIVPTDTLEIKFRINGNDGAAVPGGIPYGDGCLYGAQEGKKLDLEIKAESTSGSPITYSWIAAKRNGDNVEVKEVGTSNILSVTKADAEHSLYPRLGVEDYECWIDDGNAKKRVLFSLYLMPMEASDVKMPDGETLSVSINENVMDDLDTLLSEDSQVKTALDAGKVVTQIGLDTAAKEENAVNLEEKTAISNMLPENGTVGLYLDLQLYVMVAEVEDGYPASQSDKIEITETGNPVEVRIEVPKDMRNTDSKVDRSYEIIRVHDGTAERLDSTFHEEDQTVTFSTDKFSTYALVYADTEKTPEDDIGHNGGNSTGSTGNNAGNGTDRPEFRAAAAATGDINHVGGYMLAAFLASGVLVGMLLKKRALR